jgi:hypothetical protein
LKLPSVVSAGNPPAGYLPQANAVNFFLTTGGKNNYAKAKHPDPS